MHFYHGKMQTYYFICVANLFYHKMANFAIQLPTFFTVYRIFGKVNKKIPPSIDNQNTRRMQQQAELLSVIPFEQSQADMQIPIQTGKTYTHQR